MATQSAAEQTFDVVVIGSGFGGAAVACRLAQAGESVAVLERGKEYPVEQGSFKTTGHGTRTLRHGHFLIDQGNGMNVIRGIGVGGGSLHYFGVRLRADPEIFADPRWPAGVDRRALDPYYDLADSMIRSMPVAPNPVAGMPERGIAFQAAAHASRRARKAPEWVPLAVHSDRVPAPTPAGIPLTRCVYCGDCLVGCPASETFEGNVNARELLTLNYLAVARKHGAKIFPEHFVQTIRKPGSAFEIRFTVGDEEEPVSGAPKLVQSVHARRVVLAAGTMGSTEVLLQSRNDLPGLSPMLGLHFSGNGDFIYAMTKDAAFDLQPKSGPTIVAGCDFSTDSNKIFIEDLGAIPILGSILGLEKGRLTVRGRYAMRYLGMGTDAANGVLRLDGQGIVLDWDPTKSLPLYHQITAALRELSQGLNGRYQHPRGYDPVTGNGTLTAHPLGGCVMGETIEQGVTDARGEVFGVPGLFVADGAIVPAALATNPSFTISALAERIAFLMIHGREMAAGDAATPSNS
jgi:cholesterol oxidase